MTRMGRTMLASLALAMAGMGAAAPAQARTYSYVEIGVGNYNPYYRDGDRYRDWDRGRWEREHYRDRRWHREWRGHGRGHWRDWDDCWTEWRWNRYDERVPVRICR